MRDAWIGCEVEYDYFGDERKHKKAARKLVTAQDRSKYKKTDMRKVSNQPKEFKSNGQERLQGRILSIASQGVIVDVDGKILTATLRGFLKKEKTHSKNLITVGDFVLLERISPTEGLIVHVEPRRSILSRAENLSRRKEQLIAANIDQVIITVSVVSPAIKPALIDRYIIAAQKGGMEPVIVINKIDLLESKTTDLPFIEQEKLIFQDVLEAYKAACIPVICLSTVTKAGFDQLQKVMHDKASVFSGQSGTGKSSIINAITGKSLPIGGMVGKTNKGSHTTTTAQLIPLEFGGFCIDTPGIRSFGVWELDEKEVEHYFTEIFDCGRQCRFHDCSHFHEQDCAVMRAVEEGAISHLRYESYLILMHQAKDGHFRR